MYALDLTLDPRDSVPGAVMADLRWHLGVADAPEDVEEVEDAYPLLAAGGPAMGIGGVLAGELVRKADGWSLTARQEVHAELLPDLDSLLERLAWPSGTEGTIGFPRFCEEDVPDLLINRSGTLAKECLTSAGAATS